MKQEVIKELEEISEVVADLKKSSANTSPGIDYFQNLQERVMSEVRIHSVLQRKQKHSVLPAGYFEGMQDKVMAEINLLNFTKDKTEHNDLPEGYFDGLADKVMTRVNEKPQKNKIFTLFHYQWAAAAALILLVGYGVIHFGFSEKQGQLMVQKESKKSYDTLLNEISEEDASLLIEQFSTEEDLQYLKNHHAVKDLNLNTQLPSGINEDELDLELTEEDLEYLKTIM